MAEDQTAEKLALTREEFARFDGRVTATLEGIQNTVAEVKDDTRYFKATLQKLIERVDRLENGGRIVDKIKNTWREWIVAAVAVAALVIGIVRK